MVCYLRSPAQSWSRPLHSNRSSLAPKQKQDVLYFNWGCRLPNVFTFLHSKPLLRSLDEASNVCRHILTLKKRILEEKILNLNKVIHQIKAAVGRNRANMIKKSYVYKTVTIS